MGYGELAAPPRHNSNFDKLPDPIGTDEHHHAVVLPNVIERESECMQHVLLAHTMTVRRVENDRLSVLVRKVTCHKITCQSREACPRSRRTLDRLGNRAASLASQPGHHLRVEREGNPPHLPARP